MDKLTALLEKTNENKAIKLLNYPDVRQSTKDRCGMACVQTVLQYYGEDYREDELYNYLRDKSTSMSDLRENASLENIIKLFNEKEYKVDDRSMNINDIISYINRDIPVIVLIQAWGEETDYSEEWGDGHYVVAIGYTRNKILFEDPSCFQICYLTHEDFMSRWHDQDGDKKYINYGIAVHGKKPKYDKNKWVKIG